MHDRMQRAVTVRETKGGYGEEERRQGDVFRGRRYGLIGMERRVVMRHLREASTEQGWKVDGEAALRKLT